MTIAHSARLNSAHLDSAHLSEEALNDVLIGLSSLESDAHLAVCSACRSRVEEFQSTTSVARSPVALARRVALSLSPNRFRAS